MIYYQLHNLLEVILDPAVGKALVDSIDFQIGYFKSHRSNINDLKNIIYIKPYSHFDANYLNNMNIFHLSKGIQGSCFIDDLDGFAIEKYRSGFKIYSDTPNFIINLYIQFILVENQHSMIHAAAVVDKQNRVFVLPAAGGAGKTALLGNLVKNHNFRHMGDDIIILDEHGKCLSFPRCFVFKEYHRTVYPEVFKRLKIRQRSNYRIKKFILDNAPFVGMAKNILKKTKLYHSFAAAMNISDYLATVPVEEIFGENATIDMGQLHRIIFLEKYRGKEFKIEGISEDQLSKRMFSIIHHEWILGMQQLLKMGAMDIIDLPSYFKNAYEIIKKGISGKNCQIFFIPENASPDILVERFIDLARII